MTGFICLSKPTDMTSFTAANLVRRITNSKKAGHTGTLDPMATGVLPIALSGATRFIELLPTHDKAYRARVKLGVTTDTLDITGKILSRKEVKVSKAQILKTVNSFLGESMQTPPMYSAISKDGVRLYDLARQGVEVEREQRKIHIYSIEAKDFYTDEFTLEVSCSAGTYIRSLADDIGKQLGCGATLTALCRTSANGFQETDCITLEELRKLAAEDRLTEILHPVDAVLKRYPELTVTQPQAVRFHNGGELFRNRVGNPKEIGYYRVYSPEHTFLGLGEITSADSEVLAVKRVLSFE